jgi:hypothetical protein
MKRILGIGAVALLSVAALTACGSASGDDLTEDFLKAVQENDADLVPSGAVCSDGKLDDFDYAYSAFQFSSKGSFDDTVEYANDSWDDLKKADREAAKFVKAEAYKTRSSDKSSRDEDDVLEHHDVIITGEDGFAVGQASVITTDALGDTCIVSAGFYPH